MDYLFHVLIQLSVLVILALGQHLVLGRAGLLFVAQAALFGIGAYTCAITSMLGMPSLTALLIGSIASVGLGIPMALPALRLRGDYLLVASLGLCEIIRSILNNWGRMTGGAAGLMNIPPLEVAGVKLEGPSQMAPLFFTITLCGVGFFYLIENSPLGRLLYAVGEDPEAIRGMGKSVRRARMIAVAIACAWAGLVGGLSAFYLTYLDPTRFTIWESIFILAMVILGGSDYMKGALIGASVLVIFPEFLRFGGFPQSVAGPLRQIIIGIALIAIMRYRPNGLLGPKISWRKP